MSKLKCIIIEDEPLALERTRSFVEKVPFLELLDTFDNAIKGLFFLNNNDVDLLFLDINMDELTGIELLESSKLTCAVIITTAYQEYALKGYELSVTDYLLKPFTFNRFLQAVNKVHEPIQKTVSEKNSDYIFIKTENRLEKVNFNEIIFIEGMRDYRRIHTQTKKIMTLQNFKELELLIPPKIICRVHKSFIVSLNKIDAVERSRIHIKDQIIPISESYREQFFKLINT